MTLSVLDNTHCDTHKPIGMVMYAMSRYCTLHAINIQQQTEDND